MHSLETGIILGIAAFFFFSFMAFTFLRETNISKEIQNKYNVEKKMYEINGDRDYKPEMINNIANIVREESKKYAGSGKDEN